MEAKKEVKREVYQVDQVEIENSIDRCNKEEAIGGLQASLEEFKTLGIGNLTDSVFEAIVTGELSPLRSEWDNKILKEAKAVTTNKEMVQLLVEKAKAPWEEFEKRVKMYREERYDLNCGGESIDSFFKMEKGKVVVNSEVIKAHYTTYLSDEAIELRKLAEEAKAALDKVAAFMKKRDRDLLKSPVLPGDRPFMAGPYRMPGDEPIIFQEEGEIKYRIHEIACY